MLFRSGLLRLPGDDAALDVDLPGARARAIHAVRGTHDLVVRPAVAIGVLPGAVFTGGQTVTLGKSLFGQGEVRQSIQKVTHGGLSVIEVSSARNLSKAWGRCAGCKTTR